VKATHSQGWDIFAGVEYTTLAPGAWWLDKAQQHVGACDGACRKIYRAHEIASDKG